MYGDSSHGSMPGNGDGMMSLRGLRPSHDRPGLTVTLFYPREAFIPILLRPMVQPGADLRDDLVGQEGRRAGGLVGRNLVRDAIQERPRKHVAGAGQIFRLTRESGHVLFNTGVPNVGAVRP